MELSRAEMSVIIDLINEYQGDGARWSISGVGLTELRNKFKEELSKKWSLDKDGA